MIYTTYILPILCQFRNGEKSRAKDEAEHKSTYNSCRSTETKQVKTTTFKEPRAKPDISNVGNLSSPKTLKISDREASTRPDETIISNTADHVSTFCRLSNYSDFLRAPFSQNACHISKRKNLKHCLKVRLKWIAGLNLQKYKLI